jgi:exosortase A
VTPREVGSTSESAPSWRNAYITLGCCLVVLVFVHRATVASMLQTWSRDPFGHGYLVVPAAAYLAWSRRDRLQWLSPRPAVAALTFLGLVSFLWLLGNLTNTTVLQQLCLVAMVIGVTWSVLGTAAARALVFPLGLLLFALPLGDRLVPVLQEFTGRFAVKMLTLSNVPAILEGHVISIAGDRWRVAEACGGLSYLVTSVGVGYLYAGAVYRQWGHRVAFVFASAVLPIAGNGLRVYTTILLDLFGPTRVALGLQHQLFGLFVFGIIISVLLMTCGSWSEQPSTGTGPMSVPQGRGPRVSAPSIRRTALCATVGMLLVASGPVAARVFWPRGHKENIRQNDPQVSLPWKPVGGDLLPWAPRFFAPRSEFLQTYKSGTQFVKLYVASYGASQPDVKLASKLNLLYDEPWSSAGERDRTIILEGQSFKVSERVLRSPQSSLLVWNWYQVEGSLTGDDYVAKLLLAKARLFRSREGSAAIALATEEQPGVDAAAVLREFIRHVSFSEEDQLTGEQPPH